MSQTKVTDAVRDVTAVDGTKIDAVDGAKITTGTIPEARITTLAATKLTGSIDAARVPAGAVTQHVTATDLTAVHQAIATLGLHTAVSDNKAAFNLPNAFIDTFEDDTGITTQTNVDRVPADEFVASVYTDITYSALTDMSSANWTAGGGTIGEWSWSGNDLTTYNNTNESGGTTDGAATPVVAPANTEFEFHFTPSLTTGTWGPYTGVVPSAYSGDNDCSSDYGTGHVHQYTGSMTYIGGTGGDSPAVRYNPSGTFSVVDEVNYNGTACKFVRDSSNYIKFYSAGSLIYTSTSAHSDAYEFCISEQGGGSNRGLMSDLKYIIGTVTAVDNATGTLISDTQTAPAATTEVSGVILYKDNAGTATLGTHLKIYFTADNGSNWAEAASYGTAQTFSGTTKQVKLGKTTVTSGTQVAMKAIWASQASTTMETQLHGWAVNY